MNLLSTLVLAAEATPTPDPDVSSPGPVAFVMIGVIALATMLLLFDLVRRVRRTNYRAEINAMLDAEEIADEAERVANSAEDGEADDEAKTDQNGG